MGPFSWVVRRAELGVGRVVAAGGSLARSAGTFLLDSAPVNQILPVSIAQPRLPVQGGGGSKAQAHQHIHAAARLGLQLPSTERPPATHLENSKPQTCSALFFSPPLLTLVYSHVVSQTEGQMPPQQMSMTSNYTVQRAWWRGCA